MKIVLFGGSGLIGSFLSKAWIEEGYSVFIYQRESQGSPLYWNGLGVIDKEALEGADLLVNLSGQNLMAKRWNQSFKQTIFESRIRSTALLTKTILELKNPPKLWINASAIGYYGSNGDQEVDERFPCGDSFLTRTCELWEKATFEANLVTRVIQARFGIVLDPRGGALKALLPLFRVGLGATAGTGKEWISWTTLNDIKGAFDHFFVENDLKGPVNVAGPNPVTSKEFAKTIGEVLRRPCFIKIPPTLLKLVIGEGADLLLTSAKVSPSKLIASHYQFKDVDLKLTLRRLLQMG